MTTGENPTDYYKGEKDSNGLCVESLGDRRASVGIRYTNNVAATCLSSFLGLLSSQVGKLSPSELPRAASYQHLLKKTYLSNSYLTSPRVEPDWVTCPSLNPIAWAGGGRRRSTTATQTLGVSPTACVPGVGGRPFSRGKSRFIIGRRRNDVKEADSDVRYLTLPRSRKFSM